MVQLLPVGLPSRTAPTSPTGAGAPQGRYDAPQLHVLQPRQHRQTAAEEEEGAEERASVFILGPELGPHRRLV